MFMKKVITEPDRTPIGWRDEDIEVMRKRIEEHKSLKESMSGTR